MKKLWFAAKRYGWGWTPCSWEGWAVLGVFLVLYGGLIFLFQRILESGQSTKALAELFICVAILVAILLLICWKKGEKPRWRCGKD